MATDRKKAPAARKKDAAKPGQTPEPEASAPAASAPDVFDEAIAARQQPPLAQDPPSAGFSARVTRPDPFNEMIIALSNDNDGPKTRLYRNQRFQQMAIQFDEKPDESIRQKLRDDGWTWRSAEGAWTKQLGDRPSETHRNALELLASIANDIRQANGLEPVTMPAQGR
jgi:hypothetical protein